MYLYAEKYVSQVDYAVVGGEYTSVAKPEYAEIMEAAGMSDLPKTDFAGLEIKACIGYWRKANAVHGWFVDNVQDGEDECKPHHVSREQLEELKNECLQSLAVRAGATSIGDTLEPRAGFFFGSTEKDDWYYQDLVETVKIVDGALALDNNYSFIYQSSW